MTAHQVELVHEFGVWNQLLDALVILEAAQEQLPVPVDVHQDPR